MVTDNPLISNTSVFSRHRSFGYETRKELRLEYQALILTFRR